jgi:aldose sugar dehydrogenase
MTSFTFSHCAAFAAIFGGLCRITLVGWALMVGAPATSAPAAVGPEELSRLVVATRLDRPEAVVPLDKKSALVAERSGRVLFVDIDGDRIDLGQISIPGSRIFYMPERPFSEGLKDLVADQGRPGTFLWCATTGSEQAVSWTVGRAKVSFRMGKPNGMETEMLWRSEPQPWTRSSPPPFLGCRMAIDGGDVLVAMGANSRASGSGRIVRVSMSSDHEARLVSTGHRNPSGLAFYAGALWEVEHGPKGGDELNLIVAGKDYGWPDVSQGKPDDAEHSSFLPSRQQSIDPRLTWTPSIAPSSMTTSGGKFYVGALQRKCVVEVTPQGDEVMSQRRFLEFDQRVRDVRAGHGDEDLWVLTDGPDAKLYRVTLSRTGAGGSQSGIRSTR